MKRNNLERAKMVLAMERIARCINDESVFYDVWLSLGVADGDISPDTTPEEVDDYYLEDDNFSELIGTFLKCMKHAYKEGGLYCNGITDNLDN